MGGSSCKRTSAPATQSWTILVKDGTKWNINSKNIFVKDDVRAQTPSPEEPEEGSLSPPEAPAAAADQPPP